MMTLLCFGNALEAARAACKMRVVEETIELIGGKCGGQWHSRGQFLNRRSIFYLA